MDIADAFDADKNIYPGPSVRISAHHYLTELITVLQRCGTSSTEDAAELNKLLELQTRLYNICKDHAKKYIYIIKDLSTDSTKRSNAKYKLGQELRGCAKSIIDWQADNAHNEEQKKEAADILREAEVACNFNAHEQGPDAEVKAHEKSVNSTLATIADLRTRLDSLSHNVTDDHLRKAHDRTKKKSPRCQIQIEGKAEWRHGRVSYIAKPERS